MYKTFKFRLFTNKNQERELSIMLESHRRLYNQCLEERIFCWELAGESLNYNFQCRRFTILRKSNPYYGRLNASSIQATIKRLDKTYQSFFRRVKKGKTPGFPRFKNKDRFKSFTYPYHGNGARLKDNKLRLQHVGNVRVKVHRKVEGKIKTVTIKKENNKWFVILSCEIDNVDVPKNNGPAIGIDVGLNKFLTKSDSTSIDNPRLLESKLKKLRIEQRSLSRKKKGSNSRQKAKSRLINTHWRIANKRRDFHHKTARKLVDSYSLIAVESLNINDMLKNHWLSRSISDVGWNQFLSILQSKAESAGSKVVFVNPDNTSQDCSQCEKTVKKSLATRIHRCDCGLVIDRDVNAARNILARAVPMKQNVVDYCKRALRSCVFIK